ncbi:MAG: iron-sulfur cluster assembly protein [Chloroflexia bacterium]
MTDIQNRGTTEEPSVQTLATPPAANGAISTTEDDVRETIRNEVYDPELGLNIIDLGLVYDITVGEHKADITMTLTSPGCPVGPELITNIRRSISRFEDLDEVDVHLVFSPPWHPSMMSEEAKDELGYFG